MTLRKFGISVAVGTLTLLTVASMSTPASAHRRGGHHGHHGHHGHTYYPPRPTPGRQICYGVPPHARCVPVTHR